MILHLRVVPGFWLAVEARSRPELLSRPVIMGGLPHQRGAVREATLPAQDRGVRAGMTLAQAHQQCPDGLFLVPDLPCYEAVWTAFCAVLQQYTPLVEPLEMGQAVCDLTGCTQRWRDDWQAGGEIAARIRAEIGIAPRLGIASNRLVAQLASLHAGSDGITLVETGQEKAFLADLPLSLLPDIDARLALTFQVLGLRTIAQFAALPRAAVKQRFGAPGERLHDLARGIDPRPVSPPPSRPAVSAHRECEDGTAEEAMEILHHLAADCAAELGRRNLAGALVSLTLRWASLSPPSPLERVEKEALLPDNPFPAARLPAHLDRGIAEPEVSGLFPVPYRIHSMLPQPTAEATDSRPRASIGVVQPPAPAVSSMTEIVATDLNADTSSPRTRLSAVVRTPIASAPPLVERAQRLLLQAWPRTPERLPRLRALTLEVAEFEQPTQLSFAELDRLDQTGTLRGMDAVRLQTLIQSESALAARYGDTSFRRLVHLDPAGILTERRFRWGAGLPWEPAAHRSRSAEPSPKPRRRR